MENGSTCVYVRTYEYVREARKKVAKKKVNREIKGPFNLAGSLSSLAQAQFSLIERAIAIRIWL